MALGMCSLHYQRVKRHGAASSERVPKSTKDKRWCPDCRKSRARDDFYTMTNGKSVPYCKGCQLERHREERKTRPPERQRRYLARRRRWSAANAEKLSQQSKALYRKDPERAIAKVISRNARVRGARTSDMTFEAWLAIVELFDSRCAYCLKKVARPERDHVIAITRGGADTPDNVVPSCKPCNARKNNRPVFFMAAATT